MRRNTKIVAVLGAAAAAIALTAGVGLAGSVGGEDAAEVRITGEALTKATAAALQHTGGGRVTDTEVGDEESYYEVEVTLADGRQVDVQLDQDFRLVGSKTDKGK
jgi:hypothetical protein